jgi:hypothetical protein
VADAMQHAASVGHARGAPVPGSSRLFEHRVTSG